MRGKGEQEGGKNKESGSRFLYLNSAGFPHLTDLTPLLILSLCLHTALPSIPGNLACDLLSDHPDQRGAQPTE